MCKKTIKLDELRVLPCVGVIKGKAVHLNLAAIPLILIIDNEIGVNC